MHVSLNQALVDVLAAELVVEPPTEETEREGASSYARGGDAGRHAMDGQRAARC